MESLRIVERGEATPQDVDIAMKLGAGFPMGPFELADVSFSSSMDALSVSSFRSIIWLQAIADHSSN